MRKLVLLGLAAAVAATLMAQQAPPATHLKVGDTAPDFELQGTGGKDKVKLSSFRGKKNVVLAFFPAAFTGG
jgi:peroxiredoxin